MNNVKIFLADDVNEDKLTPLSEADFNVVKKTKLPPEELAVKIKDPTTHNRWKRNAYYD